jgi:small neutral amino acid transporter SnatA (MarC family)
MSIWVNIILILLGLFVLAGSIFNWEWFMTSRRASFMVRLLGRTGARIFYMLAGLVLVGLGIAGALGFIG